MSQSFGPSWMRPKHAPSAVPSQWAPHFDSSDTSSFHASPSISVKTLSNGTSEINDGEALPKKKIVYTIEQMQDIYQSLKRANKLGGEPALDVPIEQPRQPGAFAGAPEMANPLAVPSGVDQWPRGVNQGFPELPSLGMPPVPKTLHPSQILWVYLDPNGVEQGPFPGTIMQDWYADGYLKMDLHIRRKESSSYQTLGEFIQSIGEFTYPFLKSLPDLSQPAFDPYQVAFRSSPYGGMHQQWGVQQNGWQQPQQQRNASPFLQSQSLHSLQPQLATGDNNMMFADLQSRVLNNVFASPELPQQGFQQKEPELAQPIAEPAQPQPVSQHVQPESAQFEPAAETVSETATETATESAYESAEPAKPAKTAEPVKPVQEELKFDREAKKEPETPQPAWDVPKPSQPASLTTTRSKPKTIQVQVSSGKTGPSTPNSASAVPAIAPWASAAASPATAKAGVSLAEIQEQERKERLRQKEVEEKQRAAQLAQRLAEEEAAAAATHTVIPDVRSGTGVSSAPARWAAATSSAPKVQSLAEIHRQQAQEAAKKQQQQAKAAQLAKNSFAAIASSSADPSWTVISKKPVAKAAAAASTKRAPTTAPTPAMLRSVSSTPTAPAVAPTPIPAYVASPSQPSPSREFLDWCRAQFSQLNGGVKREELLSIMLQMPSNSAETQEIIADTVYSNSSTMDGRRFAQEFMKRRKAVEALVKRSGMDFSWSEAQARSDASKAADYPEEDDWSSPFTKVVSKKNKRRN